MNRFRQRKLPLACLGVAVLVALVFLGRLATGEPEPRFEGRTLSEWLDDPLLTRAEIQRAVRSIGTNALPHFERWLEQSPTLMESGAGMVRRQTGYLALHHHPAATANLRAMHGFLLLGETAAPALPWLEARLARRDADFEFYLKIVALCGEAGFPLLDRLASIATFDERKSIINALAFSVGEQPVQAVRLAALLEAPDAGTREHAIQMVVRLGGDRPPELQRALDRSLTANSDSTPGASHKRTMRANPDGDLLNPSAGN